MIPGLCMMEPEQPLARNDIKRLGALFATHAVNGHS